jgi:hypothetical protein
MTGAELEHAELMIRLSRAVDAIAEDYQSGHGEHCTQEDHARRAGNMPGEGMPDAMPGRETDREPRNLQ